MDMKNRLMRERLKKLYPNETWARKVEKMGPSQVYVIYKKRFYDDGTMKPYTRKKDQQIPGQMSFSDYLGGNQ